MLRQILLQVAAQVPCLWQRLWHCPATFTVPLHVNIYFRSSFWHEETLAGLLLSDLKT